MNEPEGPSPPSFSGQVPCIHCSYNLDGRPLGSPCPECGSSTSDSLESLYLADIAYVDRLRGGAIIAAVAAGIGPTLFLFGALIENGGSGNSLSQAGCIGLVSVVGPLIAWGGMHEFAAPRTATHPSMDSSRPRYHALGRAAVVYAILYLIASVAMPISMDQSGRTAPIVAALFLGLAGEAWCFRNMLFVSYAAGIARRGCRRKLSRVLRASRWWIGALALIGGLSIAGFVVGLITDFHGDGWAAIAYIGVLLNGLLLLWLVAWPALLIWLAVSLRRIKRTLQSKQPTLSRVESK